MTQALQVYAFLSPLVGAVAVANVNKPPVESAGPRRAGAGLRPGHVGLRAGRRHRRRVRRRRSGAIRGSRRRASRTGSPAIVSSGPRRPISTKTAPMASRTSDVGEVRRGLLGGPDAPAYASRRAASRASASSCPRRRSPRARRSRPRAARARRAGRPRSRTARSRSSGRGRTGSRCAARRAAARTSRRRAGVVPYIPVACSSARTGSTSDRETWVATQRECRARRR